MYIFLILSGVFLLASLYNYLQYKHFEKRYFTQFKINTPIDQIKKLRYDIKFATYKDFVQGCLLVSFIMLGLATICYLGDNGWKII